MGNKEVTLSIITVCYNEIKTIQKTINSVINQTWQNFEWIVIDGGSTDGTFEKFVPFKCRISNLVTGKDRGIYHAMNKGITLAEGDYLLFLNAGDSFYSSNTLATIAKYNLSKYDIIFGSVKMEDNYSNYINTKSYKKAEFDHNFIFYEDGVFVPPKYLSKHNLYYWTLPHQSTFYKRSLFKKKHYDESYIIAADYELLLWAFFKNKSSFKKIDDIIVNYNMHGLSESNKTALTKENNKIRAIYYSNYYRAMQIPENKIKVEKIINYFKYPKYTIGKLIKFVANVTLLSKLGFLKKHLK